MIGTQRILHSPRLVGKENLELAKEKGPASEPAPSLCEPSLVGQLPHEDRILSASREVLKDVREGGSDDPASVCGDAVVGPQLEPGPLYRHEVIRRAIERDLLFVLGRLWLGCLGCLGRRSGDL